MRLRAIGIAGLCLGVASVAFADSADDLRTHGEQLAKDGRFTEAIDAFKAAERIQPRARHACLIALAYTRRELWPQAEIYLEACEKRATAADPLPDWVPVAKRQLVERLASANVAAVEIRVEPAGTDVKLAVSSFAPDELFGPRTIHLPPGHHVFLATATGFEQTQQSIDITDNTPKQITITLQPPAPPPRVVKPVPPSKTPWIVMGAGAAVALAGGVVHLTAYRSARQDMLDANHRGRVATTPAESEAASRDFDAANTRFGRDRTLTIALYATGAAVIGVGVFLQVRHREAPVVGIVPARGGAALTVEWSR